MRKLLGLALLTVLASPQVSHAQSAPADSCKKFVQGFYDWYVALSQQDFDKHYSGVTDIHAIKLRPHDFETQLAEQLKEDAAAQAKAEDIVGLDFDPILAAQDDDYRWVVTETQISKEHCFAGLHISPPNAYEKGDRVSAELQIANGHWQFVNFHYPADGNVHAQDLLAILKSLRDDRRKPGIK